MPDKMPDKNKNLETGTLVAICALLLDQLHKFIMLEIYDFENIKTKIEVTGFFNLAMVWNRGISFGMFQGFEYSNYFFIALASVIIVILFYLMKKVTNKYELIAFGLIIGGATGNLVDRVRIGAVADFFDFHIGEYHWPAFNIADSCVFIGAVILISGTLFKKEKNEK
jgi:signal peptidase II